MRDTFYSLNYFFSFIEIFALSEGFDKTKKMGKFDMDLETVY